MISINGLDYLKSIANIQANIIPGGILFVAIEGDTITWKKSSEKFDFDFLNVGEKIKNNSIHSRSMMEKKILIENIHRSLFGIRLNAISIPLINDDDEVVGAFSILLPRLHPVVKAFPDFAPMLSHMFSEGSTIFATDLQKITNKQISKKFEIPSLQVGNIISEDSIETRTIKTKQPILEEVEDSSFGLPVFEACYPLFDEDNSAEVVGSFVIITPKEAAVTLRNMS